MCAVRNSPSFNLEIWSSYPSETLRPLRRCVKPSPFLRFLRSFAATPAFLCSPPSLFRPSHVCAVRNLFSPRLPFPTKL